MPRAASISTSERGGAGADLRSHQPAGLESAGGPERRFARPALPRHVGGVLARATARSRKQVAAELVHPDLREGVYAAMLGPSYETPAEIRYPAHHRRGRGRHVHRARSDRGQSHGDEGARHLLRHEHGGGHSAAEDQPRGSAGDRRAWCATRWCDSCKALLPRLAEAA